MTVIFQVHSIIESEFEKKYTNFIAQIVARTPWRNESYESYVAFETFPKLNAP